MDLKITKYLPRFKEELPPINKPTRSSSSKIVKVNIKINICEKNKHHLYYVYLYFILFQNLKTSIEQTELLNKIDPLLLVAQYERDINRLKMNHSQMLGELHKELEILRSKNRGTVKTSFNEYFDQVKFNI